MTHTFGIRREDKNRWERRVPIVPEHLAAELGQGDLSAVVQPSTLRIFPDAEYAQAGAHVEEPLDAADVVFAVKEIPKDLFLPGRAYAFFSHTIKAQPYNMPMLARLLELGCTLVDYERIVDDRGRRLVFFSRQAGQAGMIDTLHLLGARLSLEGIETPLSTIEMAHAYGDLDATRAALAPVADRLAAGELPGELTPLVVGFAGYGNVSQGAQEVFDLLPHVEVSPEALLAGEVDADPKRPLVKVVFREEHMAAKRGADDDEAAEGAFDLQDYYAHPEGYEGRFARFLPHLHVLLNGIYWETRYPRLVTRRDLAALYGADDPPRLRVIGDVSCDIEGSIECTVRATLPDEPAYVYEPATDQIRMGIQGRGPVIMAVDNLPAELARASSVHFSTSLRPFVAPLVRADRSVPFDRYDVPAELRPAVIVYNGELTPDYQYLAQAL